MIAAAFLHRTAGLSLFPIKSASTHFVRLLCRAWWTQKLQWTWWGWADGWTRWSQRSFPTLMSLWLYIAHSWWSYGCKYEKHVLFSCLPQFLFYYWLWRILTGAFPADSVEVQSDVCLPIVALVHSTIWSLLQPSLERSILWDISSTDVSARCVWLPLN